MTVQTETRSPAHLDLGDSVSTLIELRRDTPYWDTDVYLAEIAHTVNWITRPRLQYYSANPNGSISYLHPSRVAELLQTDPASIRISNNSVRDWAAWLREQAAAKAIAEALAGERFITLAEAELIIGMTPAEYQRTHYFIVHKWEEFLPEYYWRTPQGGVRKMRGGEIDDQLDERPAEILILESAARRFAYEKPGVEKRLNEEWANHSDNC